MGRPKGSKNKPKLNLSEAPKIDSFKELCAKNPQFDDKFTKLELRYQIVELDKPRTQVGWDKESAETVITLQAHPGFLILLNKLDLQAALLKAKLVGDRHKELKDVEFFQNGIFWCNWLKNQLNAATQRITTVPRAALSEEEQAFRELQSALTKVGEDSHP